MPIMPTEEQKKKFYTEELKRVVKEGKLICWMCKTVLGGKAITGLQLDSSEPKVSYKCPREDCPNHNREGYRTLRNLQIPIYDTEIPKDLAEIEAPVPPQPPANLSSNELIGEDEVDGDGPVDNERVDEQPAPPTDPRNDPHSEE